MLHIGITGHRFLADIPRLQAGIDQALTRITEAYPGEPWSIISSLAEGADQLVVRRALLIRSDADLIVPLPLPIPAYTQEFSSALSLAEFEMLLSRAAEVILPPRPTAHNGGYWLAGKYMLERCDVLIALWDGKESQGQGGTGDVVKIARQKKLPLAWVKCGNRRPETNDATILEADQGSVTFEGI